ncbi:MAG TPA: peptide chain release factor 2 [Candidatus Saccharimonadales bacterium]|nr:peptide chain release factor 2 [Candidatus Saccharimonadales bacterium]
MEHLKVRLAQLSRQVQQVTDRLNLSGQLADRAKLQAEMAKADFWQDNKHAQEVSKQEADLTRRIDPWRNFGVSLDELSELIGLGDDSMSEEITKQIDELEKRFNELKKDLRFQGQYDDHDVILSIYAGAGGTDAQDWAQMLERMYLRWAETQRLNAQVLDESAGEEAGIKSASLELTGGSYLYGKLSGEHGVHRLVRLSPFNSAASRETSFAKVEVLPVIDKPDEVQVDEKDLKIDVYRAGGHGGQSVNTTDSAVRVTHLPTGVTVSIQNERSQLQNRETALTVLRSRLAQLQLEQHAKTLADVKGPSQSAQFGNQIRNYVLHPYKQVKDNRSGYESSDVEKVLDGNLDPLIDAWLEIKH